MRVIYICNGRAYPYTARHHNHCVGARPHSKAQVLVRVGDPETWMKKILS